jgi:hypothetical protein
MYLIIKSTKRFVLFYKNFLVGQKRFKTEEELLCDYYFDYTYKFNFWHHTELGKVLLAEEKESSRHVELVFSVRDENGKLGKPKNYNFVDMKLGYYVTGFPMRNTLESCFEKFKVRKIIKDKEITFPYIDFTLPVLFRQEWVQMIDAESYYIKTFIIPNVYTYEMLCKRYGVGSRSEIVDLISKIYDVYEYEAE